MVFYFYWKQWKYNFIKFAFIEKFLCTHIWRKIYLYIKWTMLQAWMPNIVYQLLINNMNNIYVFCKIVFLFYHLFVLRWRRKNIFKCFESHNSSIWMTTSVWSHNDKGHTILYISTLSVLEWSNHFLYSIFVLYSKKIILYFIDLLPYCKKIGFWSRYLCQIIKLIYEIIQYQFSNPFFLI